MKKNDLITVTVEELGFNGEGVSHFNGTTVFVPFVLPGETAEVKVLKVKGSIAFCKLQKLLTASSDRVEPRCLVFKKCGGCQLQHLEYQKQLELKTSTVKTCLKKIAGIDFDVPLTVPSPLCYAYRNKLQLPVRNGENGVKIGFFRENSHDVIDIVECPLHGVWAKELIAVIKKYITENEVECYDDEKGKGVIKHLVARMLDGKLIVTIVAASDKIPAVNRLIDGLSEKFDEFSLFLNVNKKQTNVVLGDRFIKLYGDGEIALNEFGISYSVGAESFMQVNSEQKTNLYKRVFELTGADKNTVVIDGYSGAGVLTAMLAKNAKRAYGVEIIAEAVQAADNLAKANGLEGKMTNVCGDCAKVLPGIIEKAVTEGDKTVLVLDPPRKGVDESIIKSILQSKPEKIVYISCSPQSLARDLGFILGTIKRENSELIDLYADKSCYELELVEPFDMFPHTKHVETLVVLSHKN